MRAAISMHTNRFIRYVCAASFAIHLLTGCASQLRAQVYEKVFSFTDARAAELAASSTAGAWPRASLVQGSDGNFYGTTDFGGTNNAGTVFKMTPAGALTTLVEFGSTNKGIGPRGLVQGSDNNLYGTTVVGGWNNAGTIFRITPDGVLTTLVEFTDTGPSNNGRLPSGPVQGGDGN